jgi:hypothetical protein
MVDRARRVELTLRLWGTGDLAALDEYIEHLRVLSGRYRGRIERRAAEVDGGPGQADAVLVYSFPNGTAVDGFLRDPLRSDPAVEDLMTRAVTRALITDAHHHAEPDDATAEVVEIRGPDPAGP